MMERQLNVHNTSKDFLLWCVILDNQSRTVCLLIVVAAVESQLIVFQIIIVIDLESQAELCYALQVYVLEGSAVYPGPVPAVKWVVLDYTDRIRARWALEIRDLQASVWERAEITEHAKVDIYQDVLVGRERIHADYRFLFDHQ